MSTKTTNPYTQYYNDILHTHYTHTVLLYVSYGNVIKIVILYSALPDYCTKVFDPVAGHRPPLLSLVYYTKYLIRRYKKYSVIYASGRPLLRQLSVY